jgi:hypothetical protein
MLARSGFARLRPLIAITALAAGTVALLAGDRPEPRPPQPVTGMVAVPCDGGCETMPAPCPSSGIVDYYGQRWKLADMPGRLLVCLDLRDAEWFGVDLHSARFVGCDFRGADLRQADLRRVSMWSCDLRGADLTGADVTRVGILGATYDRFTHWPDGFNLPEHGARLEN